jgi:predicted DNA-binding protein (UPF0251 family)
MGRPIKPRTVCSDIERTFVPEGGKPERVIRLTVEEYETIRLIDYAGLSQLACADMMEVARTTVQAIYESARFKIADAFINQKTIVVKGGHYALCNHGAGVRHCLKNEKKQRKRR